ncbi:vitamin B12 dependent-methionine synthase activation domain-containing protein [Bacteroides propionicifaciens]|jgi:hypothetical protein|uniref:vitamin B12 dependent-methionine synthase activation domain-containing protein n=1 Tax=Bacteroides propionicifaciens TaxID=392838 RepID=UPI00037B3B11|nr:vitamin B12 dependent-methionine synthase activation domain-containing protein [Bacteroides propionicifaciens]
MIIKHNFRDLISKINWEAYFMDWKYHKRFATIANAQGCDVVKASWLIDFEEKDRATASEVMQLLKETYRILEQLDRDYTISTLHESTHALPASLQELIAIERQPQPFTLMVATSDPEIDLLYANNPRNQKIVKTVTNRMVEAAIIASREQIEENLSSFAIDPMGQRPRLWVQLDELLDFKKIGVEIGSDGNLSPQSAHCAIIM